MTSTSHVKAGTYLDCQTILSPKAVLTLAESIAQKLFRRSPDRPGPIRKVASNSKAVEFSIKNLLKADLMRFQVITSATDDGSTSVHVKITYFTTLQRKMFGIPTEPKRLEGWETYSTFLATMESAIQDADGSARSVIMEEAG